MKLRLRNVCALLLIATLCLPITHSLSKPAHALAVFDSANYQAQINHFRERLYEISQRAAQLALQVREIQFWLIQLERWSDLPIREALEVAETILDTFERMKHLHGQVQAITIGFPHLLDEFDFTYATLETDLTYPRTEILDAGTVTIEHPLEDQLYKIHRTFRTARGSLLAAQNHLEEIFLSSEWLAELKLRIPTAVGDRQLQEIVAAAQAHTAEQVTLLRGQAALQQNLQSTSLAHQLDKEAARIRSATLLHENLADSLGPFPHLGHGGVSPLPTWLN